ncbi:heavy metal translocating P-type ATPase [Bhargavaea beijingensis]|uniref:Cd(2+)-exporting ATPase n=1 Tax=Bhargavaea beijingensis TaxID=426756 RepID=A0ABX9ZCS9_9BACL|nr:cation-translocating P-type ATPase [Bhargavaea beijingensis]RSK31959.1 cation-translocating P-type ATPase [Bhargavaea beijingensis]
MTGKQKAWITAVTGGLLVLAILFHLTGLHGFKSYTLILSTVIAGFPIALKALQALRMKAFSIELLVTIAVVGALFIGEYVESAVVTFLFLFGAYLEARTLEKTRKSLKDLVDMAPQEATVVRDGREMVIAADEVEAGDRVVIRTGGKVPVDGRVAGGRAHLNEAAITGESVPASKADGDPVFSGTIVDSGYLEVIAEKTGDDTTFARIIELVEEAQESKTKTQQFLERFANIYTPGIVVLSVIVYLLTRNIELTLTFLVIACPGALVISAPVSIVAGIGNGAKNGVLFKGGESVESLAKIDTVVFDKTGTLTKGRPEVTAIDAFGGNGEEWLRMIAAAETASEHHLGRTIVEEAESRGMTDLEQPEEVDIIKGHGLAATVGGKRVIAGTRKLMAENGISVTPEAEAAATAREKAGNTAIFAAVDGRLHGLISIADRIRPEAKDAIRRLRASGVRHIIMLTGDNRHAAALVGRQLGLDEVHAELLPEDKVAFVKKQKDNGRRVAMAGDGVNDAPAIATADIGIAMGAGGTDVSMETADVVLMADRLDQFAHARSLAKATVRNMKQNTWFAVGTVFLLLAGVLLGKIFLASGMLIHELSVLIVILNAIRLVRYNGGKKERLAEDVKPAGPEAAMAE